MKRQFQDGFLLGFVVVQRLNRKSIKVSWKFTSLPVYNYMSIYIYIHTFLYTTYDIFSYIFLSFCLSWLYTLTTSPLSCLCIQHGSENCIPIISLYPLGGAFIPIWGKWSKLTHILKPPTTSRMLLCLKKSTLPVDVRFLPNAPRSRQGAPWSMRTRASWKRSLSPPWRALSF